MSRLETGPLAGEDDWAGVFIRGDNAMYYALQLERLLKLVKDSDNEVFVKISVEGLLKTLNSCYGKTDQSADVCVVKVVSDAKEDEL